MSNNKQQQADAHRQKRWQVVKVKNKKMKKKKAGVANRIKMYEKRYIFIHDIC